VRKLLRSNIEIEVTFTEQPALIHADPAHMEHIILRLCVNAGEAMPKGGNLQVTARTVTLSEEFVAQYAEVEPGAFVRVAVSDTGHGIPPDTINDIFHPFFTTREFTHRGLGLSSVYGLVQRYKGIITVESEVGQGTAVDVYLPRFVPETKTEEHEAPPTIEERKRTLLIVDDQQTVLDFFASVLEHEPYELLFAHDGQEALDIFKRDPYAIELVFMDMVMPRKNGLETYHELIKIRPELKVIFSSGFTLDDSLSKLIGQGDVGFLRKPFNIQQFLDTLHAAIN
jgi:CheY-like chemotaxis protein